MKVLYFSRVNKDDKKNYGVIQKCESQTQAFRNLGLTVDLVYLCNQGILKNKEVFHHFSFPWLKYRWLTYFFYFFSLLRIISQKIAIEKYQVVYIRYAMAHPLFMNFLRKIKRKNPAVVIILEIPTFPYDQESIGIASRFSLFMDRLYRQKLVDSVAFIGHYGLEKEIYGIPVIPLRNGIDLNKIKQSASVSKDKVLRLIAVANWSYWHGLDRVIKGLNKYYLGKDREWQIQLNIIGAGKALEGYKSLVKSFGLEPYVTFTPPCNGLELDRYFDQADIGIGCLGLFRKKVKLDSSLKTRAYCARGIPFIFSGKDLDFPNDIFFIKKVLHEEGYINMEEVVIFWKGIISRYGKEKGGWHSVIREYAVNNLTWEHQLREMAEQMKKS